MGVYIGGKKYVITTGPKTIRFHLAKKIYNSLKH